MNVASRLFSKTENCRNEWTALPFTGGARPTLSTTVVSGSTILSFHHPLFSPPSLFNTLSFHHPLFSPPSLFTILSFHHPLFSPSSLFTANMSAI
jgi:hypothetical protein